MSNPTKAEPKKDVDIPDKSKYDETIELLQSLYKTVFNEDDAVWQKFLEQMKKSCNIVILENYPSAKDYALKRVIAGITFWHSENSLLINMMAIAEKPITKASKSDTKKSVVKATKNVVAKHSRVTRATTTRKKQQIIKKKKLMKWKTT